MEIEGDTLKLDFTFPFLQNLSEQGQDANERIAISLARALHNVFRQQNIVLDGMRQEPKDDDYKEFFSKEEHGMQINMEFTIQEEVKGLDEINRIAQTIFECEPMPGKEKVWGVKGFTVSNTRYEISDAVLLVTRHDALVTMYDARGWTAFEILTQAPPSPPGP